MWQAPLQLKKPGLFITATDTHVGKTVATCAIAHALRSTNPGQIVGVSKPFASGCRHDREGLVNEDAEALAHFADCRLPLEVINPIRFAEPLAPAVAAEQAGEKIDWELLRRRFVQLDEASDFMLIEGVGGLLVPLDPDEPKLTVLDLAKAIGYPVLVVTRSILGTLNHTAMTVRLLKQAGLPFAGIVMNSYDAESDDPSVPGNRLWLDKMCGRPGVLTILPRADESRVQPHHAQLDPAILDAAGTVNWANVLRQPK